MSNAVAGGVDLPGDFEKRYTAWWHALARAVGFEYAGALSAESSDPATRRLIRQQHHQNAELLKGLLTPGVN